MPVIKGKPYKWYPKTRSHFNRMRDLNKMILNAICIAYLEWKQPLNLEKVIHYFNWMYPNSKVTLECFKRRIRELREKGKITARASKGSYIDIIPLDHRDIAYSRTLLTYFIDKR